MSVGVAVCGVGQRLGYGDHALRAEGSGFLALVVVAAIQKMWAYNSRALSPKP